MKHIDKKSAEAWRILRPALTTCPGLTRTRLGRNEIRYRLSSAPTSTVSSRWSHTRDKRKAGTQTPRAIGLGREFFPGGISSASDTRSIRTSNVRQHQSASRTVPSNMAEQLILRGELTGHNGWVTSLATSMEKYGYGDPRNRPTAAANTARIALTCFSLEVATSRSSFGT